MLDLGCATGVPISAEIAKRHRVVGVDISPRQIEQARRNVREGAFICCDATQAEFAPRMFDAVVSLYTFDHIPREEHEALLRRIFHWLRPGGYLLLSVEDADQPGVVTTWLDVDMYFSMYDAETTRQLVQRAGFEFVRSDLEEQQEQGQAVSYVWILARKPLTANSGVHQPDENPPVPRAGGRPSSGDPGEREQGQPQPHAAMPSWDD